MDEKVTPLPVRLKGHDKVIEVVRPFAGCQHKRAIVDERLAEIACADCGVKLNPIRFLVTLAGQMQLWKNAQRDAALASKALDERKRCRCTKCGEMTDIRRVGPREIAQLKASHAIEGRAWVPKDEFTALAIDHEAVQARLQDLCAIILEGRETREDEPVRRISPERFVKALAKARKQFAASASEKQT